MKTLRAAAACLALVSGAVFADGVPLITPGPPLAANDAARQLSATKQPEFVKLHPVVLNKNAFGANVLTVVIDGKEYRFVGAMMPKAPPPSPKVAANLAAGEKQPNTAAWSGKAPGSGVLVLLKNVDTGGLSGVIELPPSRRFNINTPRGGSAVLAEWDANRASRPEAAGSAPLPALPASGGAR